MATPSLLCAALEIALNRYLALEPGGLAQCAPLDGRVIALQTIASSGAGPGWEFFLRFSKTGVQVLDAWDTAPNVRISAPALHLLSQALRSGRGEGSSLSGVRVEGDAELLARFSAMLAKIGFDPEEWLAKWMGGGAAHRLNQALGGLLNWSRKSADTIALDTAEYLREETRDLAHRADAEQWMDKVDNLRERTDRFAARLARFEGSLLSPSPILHPPSPVS